MLEQIGAPPVATVPPGVADRFRTEVPPHQRPLSIAFAYRREPHKGIPHLVAALERVHANHPRLPVRCFGSSDEANLPAWVEQRGFLTDKELVKFYNDCAIFVLPSHYEGWGLPAAEAMASGASVVVTACGGTADFTTDGHNSLVVPPGDAEALAHTIARLVEDTVLRDRLATTGSEESTARRWPETARALRRVFTQIIDDDHAPELQLPDLQCAF